MPITMRQQECMRDVGLAILSFIALSGFVAMVAVAPGTARLARLFPGHPRWRQRYYIDAALKRLLRRGFVEEALRGRARTYRLTDRGRAHLSQRTFARTDFTQPARWDRKWRVVVFDIPERRRYLRDTLRLHLQRLGLHPIQKSVWLFPFPCEDLVRLLKVDLRLDRSVQYFTVGSFGDREEEKRWRLHFDV